MSRCLTAFWLGSVIVASHPAVTLGDPRFSGVDLIPGQPAISLVVDGQNPVPVVVASDADAQEKRAASELARYLSQISGAEFSVTSATDPLPAAAVLVGDVGISRAAKLSREGFVIQTEGQQLRICGGTPHATMFGVFALLEEQLGCRWWSWNEEHIPSSPTITVAAQDTHIEPAFQRHDCYNREAQNQANSFAWKRRTISRTNFTGGHNLCPLLKPLAAEHPDFLPMDKNGKRAFNNIHMNYTAPGMDTVLTGLLKTQIEKRKGNLDGVIYFAGMGDWYGGMDYSPESKRIYEEEKWVDPDGREKPGYSATVLRLINSAAAALEKEIPGVQIGTFAYMSLEAPPAKTRPRDNVSIRLPRLRHDTVRSVLESPKNASFRRNLDRWCELAPGRVYIWEYGSNFTNFLQPFPCLRSLAQNIRHYHQAGVAGVSIQGNYVSTGGDLAVLKNYVWSKLLWDPTRDVDELLNEFCTGYYGLAADELLAYVNLLEASVRGDKPIQADEFDKKFAWMTPELIAQARELFDRALTKTADNETYQRRVREAEVGLEAWLLWKPGTFKEEGERLIRADIGSDTFARAQNLVDHCRGASPREWGNGPKYHMDFLKMHGGPMPVLRQGPVTVKVAPVQNGQLREVRLGDTIAIDSSRVSCRRASVYYDLQARDGNRVDMSADLGVSMWSGRNQKQTAHRTVELNDDGRIHCSGSFERIAARCDTNKATFVSTYRIRKLADDIQIDFSVAKERPRRVVLSAKKPEFVMPAVTILTIARPDRGIAIEDVYHSGEGVPSGRVVFNAKSGTVTVTVAMPETQVAPKGRTSYGQRWIQLRRMSD
jgi:hypothetical protein